MNNKAPCDIMNQSYLNDENRIEPKFINLVKKKNHILRLKELETNLQKIITESNSTIGNNN